jgi:hypothetical protein
MSASSESVGIEQRATGVNQSERLSFVMVVERRKKTTTVSNASPDDSYTLVMGIQNAALCAMMLEFELMCVCKRVSTKIAVSGDIPVTWASVNNDNVSEKPTSASAARRLITISEMASIRRPVIDNQRQSKIDDGDGTKKHHPLDNSFLKSSVRQVKQEDATNVPIILIIPFQNCDSRS